MDVVVLIGRILLVSLFLSSGSMFHIGKREMASQYAASKGVPAATFLVPASGALIVVGGAMVLFGIWGDLGALLLLAFLIPTSAFMHNFWAIEDQMEAMNQQTHFMKNAGLAAGAIFAFVLFAYAGEDLGLTITGPLFELR